MRCDVPRNARNDDEDHDPEKSPRRSHGIKASAGSAVRPLLAVSGNALLRQTIALFFERPLGILAAQDREHDDETHQLRDRIEQRERFGIKSAVVRAQD